MFPPVCPLGFVACLVSSRPVEGASGSGQWLARADQIARDGRVDGPVDGTRSSCSGRLLRLPRALSPALRQSPAPLDGPGRGVPSAGLRDAHVRRREVGENVFLTTYDEHGGFFDHVSPLPVKYRNPNGVAFDTTGPRVPAIVAGPFAPQGVAKQPLDNTSILQLLAERFGHPGETFSAEVAGRRGQGI